MGFSHGIALFALMVLFQTANKPNDNAGILYGPDYAFILAAPDGWVLDDVSGRKEGLPAVFYKRGESWSRAKVVMYANPVRKSKGETVNGIIASDVSRFNKLNPGIVVEDGISVTVANGRKLPAKIFRGTKGGETEIVVYADETSCVVMLVLSGTPKDVDAARASFDALLRTYVFITSDVHSGK